MTWAFAIGLAVLAMGVLVLALKLPRGAWEAVGAALLLGIAGYAVQASPGLSGAPKAQAATSPDDGAALVEIRQQFAGESMSSKARIVTADGLTRRGSFQYAAEILSQQVRADPSDPEGWTALGNVLLGQAEGNLTEPAIEAYRRASAADPSDPAPYFFLGLGWLQAGEYDRTRTLWQTALERTEEGSAARRGMELRLATLDRMLGASLSSAPTSPNPSPLPTDP